ncbi:YlbF family regulator [Macrococcus armenti]|uniref:YlbF family regulator n=1 Tax=Macrococcus armenti TaxID=2875764 RepID=UPI001CCB27DE|nr:YlbF family regulator [Macrococcus armenti]UBH13939.1 YlbF family regulator [Macrococcus armenti]UBH23171.1 YlbF family regulator [Macrococcus armenti]
MIYTEEIFSCLDNAETINKMLLNSGAYNNYKAQSVKINFDTEVQQLKREFLKIKERYDEVQRFGRYHPDYTEVMMETRRRKKLYDMHPDVVQFRQYETQLQTLLDEIITIVAHAISNEVKVERGNPFFVDHSCSSNCGCS